MITIDKKLDYFEERPGYYAIKAVLTDGVSKRVVLLGGVPDDDSLCDQELLKRGEELFNQNGIPYIESAPININCLGKRIRDKDYRNFKTLSDSASSVPQLRAVVSELIESVEALKSLIQNS